MKCKNCNAGMVMLVTTQGNLVKLEPKTCDCCGGYYEDCENCTAGKRVIDWRDYDDEDPHDGK